MASVSPFKQRDEESGLRRRVPATELDEPSRWHGRRHHAILREHPEIKQLFGADRVTVLWVAALVVAQLGGAVALRNAPWRAIFAVAFVVGAPIAHGLGVLIHECSHNLALPKTWQNKVLAIVANLPLAAPAAIEFRHQHLLHHRYLGDTGEPDGRDTQAPMRREIEVTGRSTWRKIASFTFGRFFYGARKPNQPPMDGWLIGNAIACVSLSVLVELFFGGRALAFLIISPLLAFGPHPLGARRLSEHFTLRRDQPTTSYYGIGNVISFDVGYHVEHHDFPHVPWTRIRRLRAMALPHYERLAAFQSWTRLLLSHFFDRRYTVAQYVGLPGDYVEGESEPQPPRDVFPSIS